MIKYRIAGIWMGVRIMADYSRFKTETLKKMRESAYEKYCYETTKLTSADTWGNGMRLAKLPQQKAWERARERLYAIDRELALRKERGDCV